MKKPMTTTDLFNIIFSELKENNQVPPILDYALAASNYDTAKIMTYEFDLRSNLNYGGNEGIYLDLWIEFKNGSHTAKLGTIKTLDESAEAMRTMGILLADFIIAEYEYVNSHLDDFTWTGADVYVLDDSGHRLWGYSCNSLDAALRQKDKLLQKHAHVMVRENVTRKESRYSQ